MNISNLAKLGGTKSYDKCKSEKISKTIHEFKDGDLLDRSGKKIINKKQAIAIALSQAQTSCKYNSNDVKKLIEKVDKNLNDDKKINLSNLIETRDAISILNKMNKTKRVYMFKKLLWNKIINQNISNEQLSVNMWNEIKKIHEL